MASDAPVPAPAGTDDPSIPKGRIIQALVVLGILAGLLMGALDNFVVLTALPDIVQSLGQPNGVTFVVSAYLISSTVAIPVFGKLSDLFSRRNVFVLGLVIFIAGSLLAGLSQNLDELLAFRAIQGFGAGDFFPVGLSIIAVTFPPETRATLIGMLSGVFGIATVAGPLIGSVIVDNASWRWVFYVNIPIGVIAMLLLLTLLGPLTPTQRRHFDIPGAALLAGWVGSLMFALIQVSDAGWAWSDPRVVALLAATVVVLAAFLYWEIRTPEPLVPLRLFGRRVVAGSGGTAFLVGFAVFSLSTFVSVLVGLVLLHSGTSAADVVRDVLYALVIPLVIGAALGGQLLSRVSYRVLTATGALIAAVGLLALTTTTASTPIWALADGVIPVGGVALPLVPIGFGAGLTLPVFILAVQNEVPTADVGAASSLVQFLQNLGAAMGVSLLAVFQEWRYGLLGPAAPTTSCAIPGAPSPACQAYEAAVIAAQVHAYDQLFAVMAGLLFVTFFVAFLLVGRMPKGAPPPSAVPAP
jgi:EmrB/QacA subfamily drug resistance transporter